eukprot:Rhum_TRINITY_DN14529_c27_g1::Rhum_TRINITY_DN14529_c27_g1_i1::g.97046::m.97046
MHISVRTQALHRLDGDVSAKVARVRPRTGETCVVRRESPKVGLVLAHHPVRQEVRVALYLHGPGLDRLHDLSGLLLNEGGDVVARDGLAGAELERDVERAAVALLASAPLPRVLHGRFAEAAALVAQLDDGAVVVDVADVDADGRNVLPVAHEDRPLERVPHAVLQKFREDVAEVVGDVRDRRVQVAREDDLGRPPEALLADRRHEVDGALDDLPRVAAAVEDADAAVADVGGLVGGAALARGLEGLVQLHGVCHEDAAAEACLDEVVHEGVQLCIVDAEARLQLHLRDAQRQRLEDALVDGGEVCHHLEVRRDVLVALHGRRHAELLKGQQVGQEHFDHVRVDACDVGKVVEELDGLCKADGKLLVDVLHGHHHFPLTQGRAELQGVLQSHLLAGPVCVLFDVSVLKETDTRQLPSLLPLPLPCGGGRSSAPACRRHAGSTADKHSAFVVRPQPPPWPMKYRYC